jgi:hypothetical protein
MRCSPETPFDPIGPVIKGNSDENLRKDGGADTKGVHLHMMPQAGIVAAAANEIRHAPSILNQYSNLAR